MPIWNNRQSGQFGEQATGKADPFSQYKGRSTNRWFNPTERKSTNRALQFLAESSKFTSPGGRYAGLTIGAGLMAGEALGIPTVRLATLSPSTGISMGLIQGNPWAGGKSGVGFGGVMGYKTLFRGVGESTLDNYSIGNAILSGVETAARAAARGVNTPGLAALSRARALGLSGIVDAMSGNRMYMDLSDVSSATRKEIAGIIQGNDFNADRLVRKLTKSGEENTEKLVSQLLQFTEENGGAPNRIARFLAGVGGQSYYNEAGDLTVKHIAVGSADEGFQILRKAAGGAPRFLTKHWAGTLLGKAIAGYGYLDLASIPLRMMGANVQEGVISGGQRLMRFMEDYRTLELGSGVLPPSYQTFGSATERQRALSAIYNAKSNPASRLYGNEAVYMHRR